MGVATPSSTTPRANTCCRPDVVKARTGSEREEGRPIGAQTKVLTVSRRTQPRLRRTLRVTCPQRPDCRRDEGYPRSEIWFPFKRVAVIAIPKGGVVEPRGFEPLTSAVRLQRSPN